MAKSPFEVFRKNMKPMMAILFVILMLTWVVGDSLFNIFAGNRAPVASQQREAKFVAVKWDGGKLTNQQINDLVVRRRMLNEFLGQVEMEGQRAAYQAGVEPRPLHVQILRGADSQQQGVERSVVQTRLFADAARAAGMSVSDDALRQYLDELGRGNVSRDEMRTILNRMRGGGRVSIDDILAALREEMLARNFVNGNQYAFLTVTPDQAWRDWLRVNDRVVVEAAAIPTDKYLVDVKDPTDAELTEFFDKYKNDEAGPEVAYGTTELPSAKPGFKIPRKIDVEYIEANYDAYIAKAEEKVTEEEIKDYYEKNKDPMFVKADTGLLEDTGVKKDATPPEGSSTPDAKGADAAKPNAETPAASDADSKTAPETKADSSATPATESKGSPAKTNDQEDAKKKVNKQSSLPDSQTKKMFRLVAFEDAGKESATGKKDSAPEDKKAAEGKTGDVSGTATAEAPATAPANVTTPPAAGAATTVATGTQPKKPVQFQPLDEVKDVIRREIASNNVAEQLTKLSSEIEGQLDDDYNKYLRDTLSADADKAAAPAVPKSLTDLAPIAEKNGLKADKTGPMSLLQLRDTTVGKSVVAESQRPLWQVLFGGKELDTYQPISTVARPEGNHFVALKISDTPARVPTLAEIRDEVVKAWKFQKAAEIAQKNADDLAKKAQEKKEPLTSFFADDPSIKVVRTDPFSELTGGDIGVVNGQLEQSPFRLSQPEGLHAPDPDFMRKVFALKDGDVIALPSHDHTITYVVRVVEHQPALSELRTAYLGEANTWSGLNNMMRDHMREV
ncbi:MAG TPA: hypothetical protein VH107_03110, partial [Lacipirellulaceae bacterium]|nr:hypothetical protein [Lacipirellulaceae bacterium]